LADSFNQWLFIVKKLPEKFLESLEGIEGFDKEAFINVHESGEQVTSIRINPARAANSIPIAIGRETAIQEPFGLSSTNDIQNQNESPICHSPLAIHHPVPWSQFGFYLKDRPSFTFDPLFHAGCYYVQEASSMFLEQAFKQLVDLAQPLKVLDLCAAPGGKSTHIQSLISPDSLLISNEIIRSRNNILVDNITKWGCSNVIVTNNDPSAFQKVEGYFDVMVVDAPCSGSGLFRKDEEAIDEWSLNNVHLCSQRQQRILADALPTLKENGILVYSTCSYSRQEDEEITDWLIDEMELESLALKTENDWNIIETYSSKNKAKGYRFYPDKIKGEGLFLACFRKKTSEKGPKYRPTKMERATKKEREVIEPWLSIQDIELFKNNSSFFALSPALSNEYSILSSVLNIQYAGTGVGQIMKDRLVPEHSLAVSTIISNKIPFNDLPYEQAIKYLQRQDVNFSSSGKGWQLVRYKGHNLGWINVLSNRINNYYPKEIRILKQRNDSAFEK
jgi:16S rRNA C967 or C1407 C5-methylase (RsmB/RsmF family)/NOL1/NOP2/fmu family ribosome biogenesis protein